MLSLFALTTSHESAMPSQLGFLLREFSVPLATSLVERLELAIRTERRHEPNRATGAVESQELSWGWGRILDGAYAANGVQERSGQVGTFGTCDALHALDRVQSLCNSYHGRQPLVSETVIAKRDQALGFLRTSIERSTIAIRKANVGVVSAARYARLCALLSAYGNEKMIADSIGCLGAVGEPLSGEYPETIGWRWFLDPGWQHCPPRWSSTAIVLDGLIALEPHVRSRQVSVRDELVRLIDSSAAYMCCLAESGFRPDVAEAVTCLSALGAYTNRPIVSDEAMRRRAEVVCSKILVSLDGVVSAVASPIQLATLRVTAVDQPLVDDPDRSNRLKDGGFDISLHGPLVSALLRSANHTDRDLAWLAVNRSLVSLRDALEQKQPVQTHWLASIVDSLPTPADAARYSEQVHVEFRRFVTVPGTRATFLVISDTQSGADSTARRAPAGIGAVEFAEVQAATFEQLVGDAAVALRPAVDTAHEWSGLLHVGDVVCRGDYSPRDTPIVDVLRSAASALRIPPANVVIAPGNHDYVRSKLLEYLKSVTGQETVTLRVVSDAIRNCDFDQILPGGGLLAFHDMYSRFLDRRIAVSSGGVEVVSFLAARVTVHVISLWPVARYWTGAPRAAGHSKDEYGLDPRAKADVRDFLLSQAEPEDAVVILSHIPPKWMTSWPRDDEDYYDWMGAPVAEDMSTFEKHILYDKPNAARNQPAIDLIVSGHEQQGPSIVRFEKTWSYTAGAFHIRSAISKGSFAAKVTVDEGALRVDSVDLKQAHGQGPSVIGPPTILTVRSSGIASEDYRRYVTDSYDRETAQFIATTNQTGKYVELEKNRQEFSSLLKQRFGEEGPIRVLDVGAGAGRDSEYFRSCGFHVAAIEGAHGLAEHLRLRAKGQATFAVHEVNILDTHELRNALAAARFHGIWLCATLLHVPQRGDILDLTNPPLATDSEVIAVLAEHLAARGLFYLDNKLGHGAHLKERGNILGRRWFRYRQPEDLDELAMNAGLERIESGWYDGLNGFDAWVWLMAEHISNVA